MASSASILPNSVSTPISKPWKLVKSLRKPSFLRQNRHFPVLALASSVSLPFNVGYLETEFSGHGVTFEGIGNNCVLKMTTENGSTAKLMLPSGLITSYKPYMWHEGTLELLHTTVSEGKGGEAAIKGGVSMDFKLESGIETPWLPKTWSLRSVRGNPDTSIQVELVSVAPMNTAEVKCLVTLRQDLLGSELIITNLKSSPIKLSGSFLSHLKVSTPDATYSGGMQGSNYRGKLPVSSEFSIIPPNFYRNSAADSKSWAQKALANLFAANEIEDVGTEDYSEGEEDEDYSHMTDKMSRIYTSAPREFTIIDRGRRNSVIVSRNGLEEMYMMSPGSNHEWYGKYAYICLGPSALLKPVVLGAGESWQGSQYLQNPNL